MDEGAPAPGLTDMSSGTAVWRRRLEASHAVMESLRRDTARVTVAIAATERSLAATLRSLAAEDRRRGRVVAAARREACAADALRFAARESAAAEALDDRVASDAGPGRADAR